MMPSMMIFVYIILELIMNEILIKIHRLVSNLSTSFFPFHSMCLYYFTSEMSYPIHDLDSDFYILKKIQMYQFDCESIDN